MKSSAFRKVPFLMKKTQVAKNKTKMVKKPPFN